MPSNLYKEQRLCFKQIDNLLSNTIKKYSEGINKKGIIKEMILSYDVSPLAIKKFIKDYFIDEGLVIEKEGMLIPSTTKEVKDE